VAEYQSKFLSLLARCMDLAEKHQINIFTTGLCNPMCTDVEQEHPVTLEDAMALTRTYEQHMFVMDDAPARTTHVKPRSNKLFPKPLLLPASSSTLGPKTPVGSTTPPVLRLKWLTVAEMAAKHVKGECYNCMK
jgi:hypothetical protein